MAKDKRRNLKAYREKVRRAKQSARQSEEVIYCHLCSNPIDMTLPYHDKFAWTLDHLTPLANGGKILGDWLPAHRTCNSKKGDGKTKGHLEGATRVW